MAGVVPTGFEKKTLAQLRAEVETEVKAQVDPQFLLTTDSVSGQVTQITISKIAELWDVAEAVYNGLHRDTATGAALDAAGALIGVPRAPAAASTVTLRFTGTPGTVVPVGVLVSAPSEPDIRWRTTEAGTVSGSGTVDVPAVANKVGVHRALAGTLTRFNTPIVNLTAVTNPADANVGRLAQTDAEYLLAQIELIAVLGAQSVPAIKANVLLVPGVSFVSIFENDTSGTVDGVPPHGIEVVVDGGATSAIAETIFAHHVFSTPLAGSVSHTVSDDDGNPHVVKFSRPTSLPVWIWVQLIDADRVLYPGDAAAKQIISDAVNASSVGEKLVQTKLYPIVYDIPGVRDVIIKTSVDGLEWLEEPIVPTLRQQIVTDVAHITISPFLPLG